MDSAPTSVEIVSNWHHLLSTAKTTGGIHGSDKYPFKPVGAGRYRQCTQSICRGNRRDTDACAEFSLECHGNGIRPLHELFQSIYEDHFAGQDELAERVKAIGGHAEGRLADMVSRSKVAEHDGHASDKEMIAALLDAQETLAETLAGAGDVAASHGDKLTEDLCISRGLAHEKFAWIAQPSEQAKPRRLAFASAAWHLFGGIGTCLTLVSLRPVVVTAHAHLLRLQHVDERQSEFCFLERFEQLLLILAH